MLEGENFKPMMIPFEPYREGHAPETHFVSLKRLFADCTREYPPERMTRLTKPHMPEDWALRLMEFAETHERVSKGQNLNAEDQKKATDLKAMLPKIREHISQAWNQPGVQEIFDDLYIRTALRTKELQDAPLEWSVLMEERRNLKAAYYQIYRERFNGARTNFTTYVVNRTGEYSLDMESLEARIEEIDASLDILSKNGGMPEKEKENRGGIDNFHADKAALIAYQKLRTLHKQVYDRSMGIALVKSREELLEDVLKFISRDKFVLLVGEAGTGKTSLVRMLSRILTGEGPLSAIGKRNVNSIKTLLGSEKGKAGGITGMEFAAVTRAYSGWESEFEMDENIAKKRRGRIAFLDEASFFQIDTLSMILKELEGKSVGEKLNFNNVPENERLTRVEGSGLILAVNPTTDRYTDRPPLDPSVERVLETAKFTVSYPEMIHNSIKHEESNDELYQIVLSCLIDDYGNLRANVNELIPHFEEKIDPASQTKSMVLADKTSDEHGILYRFTLAVSELQKNFEGKKNELSPDMIMDMDKAKTKPWLEKKIIEMGILKGWLEEYRDDASFAGISLEWYLGKKLYNFYRGVESDNDRNVLKKIFDEKFHIKIDEPPDDSLKSMKDLQVLGKTEIGYLLPSTSRAVEILGEEIIPEIWHRATIKYAFHYKPLDFVSPKGTIKVGAKANINGPNFIYKGQITSGPDKGKYMVQNENGLPQDIQVFSAEELLTYYVKKRK